MNIQREYLEQKAIFEWRNIAVKKYPELELLHCNLTGIKLTIGQAVKAKKMGNLKNLPDLFLPVMKQMSNKKIYSGLYIELKAQGKKPTNEQFEMLGKLERQGFYADWCCGSDAAIILIKSYLDKQL